MRVICSSVADFLQNLSLPDEAVFQKAVRVSINKVAIGDKRDATKFEVFISAAAVLRCADGSEYILEFGKSCGFDYTDGSPTTEGTATAEQMKAQIQQAADQRGLRLLPGVLDY